MKISKAPKLLFLFILGGVLVLWSILFHRDGIKFFDFESEDGVFSIPPANADTTAESKGSEESAESASAESTGCCECTGCV